MRVISAFLFLFSIYGVSSSQSVAQFRGPGRTGIYPETGLLRKWPDKGPELLLKITGFGKGYSQPIVSGNTIFISGTKDTVDMISAYGTDGKLLWLTPYGRSWIRTYPENRCTPTVESNSIFICSGTGEICCLNAASGKINWKIEASKKYNGEIYKHGEAEALLLTDNAVIYTTGGNECTAIALNKTDGSLLWKSRSLGGPKSYASPSLIEKAGLKIILVQTSQKLIGLDAADGEVLWDYNLIQFHNTSEQGIGANTNVPLFNGNEIFVSSGYNHPALMFILTNDGRSVSLKWKNDTLDCHVGGVVMVDGNIYGSNWQNNSKGRWASLNWETGRTNWEKEWFNKGSVISADGMLYIYEEKYGNVALVQHDPTGLKIVSTFRITEGEGPHWAHPAIYNGQLFIRHGDVLMVYNLKS